MILKLVRGNNEMIVAKNVKIADSFWTRLKGLIGTREFREGEALFFPKCNNIHMWMMSISIDVFFLERKGSQTWEVLKIERNLKPWKMLPVACSKADDTLELPAGTSDRLGVKKGEKLCIAS